jgi:hypothetical protein
MWLTDERPDGIPRYPGEIPRYPDEIPRRLDGCKGTELIYLNSVQSLPEAHN